jgi:hypothetical protein
MYKSMMTKNVLKTSIFAGALLALAGCSDSDTPVAEAPDANMVSFAISADAAQVIPTNASTGTAAGTLTLDQMSLGLSGSITVTGTEVTVAHIHEGIAGSTGDLILELTVDGATVSIPESTILAADQMQSMLNGDYYLNIHSTAFPDGEIRDQLTAPGIEVVQVALSGDNEVPAITSPGSGTGYVTLDTATGSMQVRVITTGITTPNAAHVHTGIVGANGAALFALTQDTAEVGIFTGSETLDAAALASVVAGGTYFNIHSAENASGELRGQIVLP